MLHIRGDARIAHLVSTLDEFRKERRQIARDAVADDDDALALAETSALGFEVSDQAWEPKEVHVPRSRHHMCFVTVAYMSLSPV
jgi:hypothetical protein